MLELVFVEVTAFLTVSTFHSNIYVFIRYSCNISKVDWTKQKANFINESVDDSKN